MASKEFESSTHLELDTYASPDKPTRLSDIVVSKSDHYLAIAAFCMIGTTQLLIWNMVINSFGAMETNIWPGNVLSDLLGGCEHGAALVISIIMLKYNGLNANLCTFWGGLNVIFYMIFPLIPQFFSGNENISIAKPLLAVLSIGLGLCAGSMHVHGYAYASILPCNYVGYVSTGNGIAGAFSFFVYLFWSEAIFEKNKESQIKLMWCFFACGAILSIAQVIVCHMLFQKQWVKDCVEISRNKQKEDAELTLRSWGERRSFVAIFKDCWLQAFNASFTLGITLLVFPVCGPIFWTANETLRTLLNGTFQMVDLLTRWMSALGGWTRIPKKWLTICVLIRPLIVLPLFIIPARHQGIPFLGDTWWFFILMIMFTITSGWFVTLGSVYTPDCVEHPAEKEIASEIFVIALLSFITVAVFGSKLPVLGI